MRCHHYCNEPLRCPECVKRFWKWAENHTRGRVPKDIIVDAPSGDAPRGSSFYEAATRWNDHGG